MGLGVSPVPLDSLSLSPSLSLSLFLCVSFFLTLVSLASKSFIKKKDPFRASGLGDKRSFGAEGKQALKSGPKHKAHPELLQCWLQTEQQETGDRAGLALAATFISVSLGSLCWQDSITVCNWSVLSTASLVPFNVAESVCNEQMNAPFFLIGKNTKIQTLSNTPKLLKMLGQGTSVSAAYR